MNNLTIEEVFEAYYECRKNKRYAYGALSFESNYEENLVALYTELKNQTWHPGKSSCFIVDKPVKREIFAAPFRDRIVHHILIRRLNPYFESILYMTVIPVVPAKVLTRQLQGQHILSAAKQRTIQKMPMS